MKEHKTDLLFAIPAALWDGVRQLSGTLELREKTVLFRFTNFKNSHLNLCIPLKTIVKTEECLIFDIARHGLQIHNKDGRCDLFVLENVKQFKYLLQQELGRGDLDT